MSEKRDKSRELLDRFYKSRFPQKASSLRNNKKEVEKIENRAINLTKRLSRGTDQVRQIIDYISNPGDMGMKITAIASLIYLISPLDFVPDALPVIGYLEDFALIGMVAGNLLSSANEKIKTTTETTWSDISEKIDITVEKNASKMIKTRLIIVGISLGGMCLAAGITLLLEHLL